MRKNAAKLSWPRLFLWTYAMSIMSFYIAVWFRTKPDDGNFLLKRKQAFKRTASETGNAVSIIVPARNEERNIRRCVTSLLEQDYIEYEVIVVDDGSTDKTAAILDEIAHTHPYGDRLWVLRIKNLPNGWAGKPHALHVGVQEAHGDWLLFTDADTWHAPSALRLAITQAIEESADLFSFKTEQELPGFWNKVIMPVAYMGISLMYPPNLVNDPASPVAIANGQYILIRRAVYDILGGYARPDLRNTVLDDRDLARIVKENGFLLRMMDSHGLVHVHMYHGLLDSWRGWHKNAYLGSRGGTAFVILELLGLPMISIVPFLLPLLAWLTRNGSKQAQAISGKEITIATSLELATVLCYRVWLNRQLKVPWYYALTHPLAGVIFEGILAQSSWHVLTGRGVEWRGRKYHNGAATTEKEAMVSVG